MGAGSGASAMLSLKAGPMRGHDFTTLFKLDHMLKDVRLCLEEGQRAGVPFTFAGYARELYTAGMGRGHADDDFAAVVYADRFQRMGCNRARSCRGRAAGHPAQGRHPRGATSTSSSSTSGSSSTPRSTTSASTSSASRTGPSCAGRWRRACGPTASRRRTRSSADGGIAQPDRVRIRAWAEVAGHYTVTDPRCVDALSPFYVWTPDYAEKRLAWKRRHPLHVLLLRTYRIPRPVTVKVRDEYGGCRSWLELQRDLPFEGTPGALRRGVRARRRGDRGDRRRRCGAGARLTARRGIDRDAARGDARAVHRDRRRR